MVDAMVEITAMASEPISILLVEDDPDDVVIFESLLRTIDSQGHHDWQHADTIASARELIRARRYDMCFFDYQIGAETGLELLRMIREEGYSRPVIMLTGHGDEAVAVDAMKSGANDYLVKRGLTADRLEAAIRHAVHLNSEAERRRLAELALRTSEARYRDLVERVPVIVCELSADGETLFVNETITDVTGYAPEDLVGRDWWQTLTRDDSGTQVPRVHAALRANDIDAFEMTMRGKDGQDLTIEWKSANRYGRDGGLENVLCIGLDVTERVRLREELRLMAVRDELTGLNNRRGFMAVAEQQLRLAAREKTSMLMVFIDVDGLKTINDRLGHAEGDRALTDLADLMRATFRTSDITGRLGGDEFVALLAERTLHGGDLVIDRLQDQIDRFNSRRERPYVLSASIGVARYDPEKPASVSELLNRSDTAMYEQKQRGRARDVVLDS